MIYLNEFDPFAVEWLSSLSFRGDIPFGFVDDRSITDVTPKCVAGFRQCHFFAGIGGWPLAFRLARIGTDVNAWSMSCPCQPFSSAGKGKAQSDERHLWPVAFGLVERCQPEWVFGEQVSKAIGYGWLDGVFADLEAAGYTCGAVVLGAHSVGEEADIVITDDDGNVVYRGKGRVGPPHIRQRIYWGANRQSDLQQRKHDIAEPNVYGCGLQHAESDGRDSRRAESDGRGIAGGCCGMGDARTDRTGAWSDFTLGQFRDCKTRRIGTGVQPLAYGVPQSMGRGEPELRRVLRSASKNRTGRLKGYGNAIVPGLAATFIQAFMEAMGQQ
jgi:DNA (cytosine-5)-methyltransferase 1